MKTVTKHYVYIYVDPLALEIFYVGKGVGRRALQHLKDALGGKSRSQNLHKYNKIRKLLGQGVSPRIFILKDGLTHTEALDLEKQVIRIIGRKDTGAGTLTNLTDGGEGTLGRVHTDEAKRKMGQYSKGKTHIEIFGVEKAAQIRSMTTHRGEANGMWGRTHTDEVKESLSIRFMGITPFRQTYRRWLVINPNGIHFEFLGPLTSFCISHRLAYTTAFKWKNKGKVVSLLCHPKLTQEGINTIGWCFYYLKLSTAE